MPISDLERTVARAMQEAGVATCVGGHRMVFMGGCNCGCHKDASCSVPVHECEVCGDSDYGDNDEAKETIRRCAERRAEEGETI